MQCHLDKGTRKSAKEEEKSNRKWSVDFDFAGILGILNLETEKRNRPFSIAFLLFLGVSFAITYLNDIGVIYQIFSGYRTREGAE